MTKSRKIPSNPKHTCPALPCRPLLRRGQCGFVCLLRQALGHRGQRLRTGRKAVGLAIFVGNAMGKTGDGSQFNV